MQTTDVRETAQKAVDQSKSFLGKQVDDRTTQLGQQIGSVAQELRSAGDQIKQNPLAAPVAGYVDQGVGYVERLGQYLEDADSDRLIGDLEDLARRQPWTVAAGALVLGFAASRFLKTSSARRYRSGSGTTGTGYGTTGTGYGTTGTGYGTTDTTGIRSGGERYAT